MPCSRCVGARERYRAADSEQAARAGLLLGTIEEEDLKDLEKAALAFRDVVSTLGGTQAANQARARLAEMEEIEISLVVPHMYAPGDSALAKLAVRNVPKLDFRIYRIDARESFERLGSLAAAANIEVALVKADRTFSYAVPDYRRYRKERVEVPIELSAGEGLPAGAYLVAAEAEQRRAVVLVLVSPFRVVVKQSPTEVFCWATDRKSGEPQKGVEILVRDEGYAVSATTDADGVARIVHDRERGKCRVLGTLGEAVAPGLAPEAAEGGATGLAPRVSFLLDRPIYRPGSEVAFRAVLRAAERGSFVTPAEQKVPVRLRDPQGRVVAEIEAATDRFGTTHGKLSIPSEGPLGDHRLEIDFAEQTFSEAVPVQAYKKPEYLVDVSTKQRVVRPGEEIDVTFAVSYFFGGAVARAPFEWRVWRAPHAIDRERYLSHAWYLRAIEGERKVGPGSGFSFVAQGGGTTDAEGRGTFPFRTVLDATASRYLVQVMVRDTSGEWVAGSGLAWAAPVGRFAVVLPDRRTYRTGDQAEIRLVTADLGHQPVQTTGEITALLERRDAAGVVSWDPVSSAAVDTGLAGEATLRIALPEPGTYRLQFSGDDGRGGAVVVHSEVVVTGKERDLAKEARLRFEHAVYRGGETARMHLSLPRAGKPVLLSFEGERVLGYRILGRGDLPGSRDRDRRGPGSQRDGGGGRPRRREAAHRRGPHRGPPLPRGRAGAVGHGGRASGRGEDPRPDPRPGRQARRGERRGPGLRRRALRSRRQPRRGSALRLQPRRPAPPRADRLELRVPLRWPDRAPRPRSRRGAARGRALEGDGQAPGRRGDLGSLGSRPGDRGRSRREVQRGVRHGRRRRRRLWRTPRREAEPAGGGGRRARRPEADERGEEQGCRAESGRALEERGRAPQPGPRPLPR